MGTVEHAVDGERRRSDTITKIRALQSAIQRGAIHCHGCGGRATRIAGRGADFRASCAGCAEITLVNSRWADTLRRRQRFGTVGRS